MTFDIPELVRQANGFEKFNPMQEKALSSRLFDQSVVVAAPTASGKTVVAELCALDSILNKKQKVVYTCPLRALASEHYSDWKTKFGQLKIRMAISTGDFDSSSQYLKNYDLIFSTTEKLESLLRHKADWLSQVGLLVVDEVHIMGSDRGPAVEMAITKLRLINPQLRVLALSATIPNSSQIADWLSADLVQSDYRPVTLDEGVYFDGKIKFENRVEKIAASEKESVAKIVADTLNQKNKQCLVFANSRPKSESFAEKLSAITEKKLSEQDREILQKASVAILNALEQPTDQCRKLAQLVFRGAAFHHAGLVEKQRRIVESAFKKNRIKLISSTPTLAAGINVPAFRVIIPSLHRYDGSWGGSTRISVSEYKQMAGRAGRPKFDVAGEAVILASSESEIDDLMENYVRGEIEEVESRLSIEPVLRTHLLAAIATNFVFDLQSLEDFFSKTFYAFQFKQTTELLSKLSGILVELEELGFVKSSEKRFEATELGKRVSELYLDPLSAAGLIAALKQKRPFSAMTYLFLFSNTGELSPLLNYPKKMEPRLLEELVNSQDEIPVNINVELYADPNLAKKFFTAKVFEQWINETPDSRLADEFNVAPGILRSKLLVCDWLGYAAFELCQLLKLENHPEKLAKLRKRLQFGVREELLMLCEVRGIGRSRARRLFQNNVRTVLDLQKIDVADLGRLLGGEKIAEQIKQNLGQKKRESRGSRYG
ncbi:MAG: DEAD/DEAH box helicase [Candidatus Micrarchaeota archaeon]